MIAVEKVNVFKEVVIVIMDIKELIVAKELEDLEEKHKQHKKHKQLLQIYLLNNQNQK